MYLQGLAGTTVLRWPAKHIPQTWLDFIQARIYAIPATTPTLLP